MSLSPPQGSEVSTEAFEQAADKIEEKLGLKDQPRAIVFHEKDGRRHAHVVWSRIDAERMRAINLPHYKNKLRDVSRALYLEHGWDMPRGLQERAALQKDIKRQNERSQQELMQLRADVVKYQENPDREPPLTRGREEARRQRRKTRRRGFEP